jgi:hypothetical protein
MRLENYRMWGNSGGLIPPSEEGAHRLRRIACDHL